jgi:hypothetical protein
MSLFFENPLAGQQLAFATIAVVHQPLAFSN